MGTNWIAALYQKRFIKRMNDLGAVEIGPENMAMRTHASGVTGPTVPLFEAGDFFARQLKVRGNNECHWWVSKSNF